MRAPGRQKFHQGGDGCMPDPLRVQPRRFLRKRRAVRLVRQRPAEQTRRPVVVVTSPRSALWLAAECEACCIAGRDQSLSYMSPRPVSRWAEIAMVESWACA
eukprot:7673891-Pyramimonas_sp.AAC.1